MSSGQLILHGLSLSYMNLGVFPRKHGIWMIGGKIYTYASHQELWLIVSANHFRSRHKVAFAIRPKPGPPHSIRHHSQEHTSRELQRDHPPHFHFSTDDCGFGVSFSWYHFPNPENTVGVRPFSGGGVLHSAKRGYMSPNQYMAMRPGCCRWPQPFGMLPWPVEAHSIRSPRVLPNLHSISSTAGTAPRHLSRT